MKGGDLYSQKPRQRKPIPKESKTRKEEKKYYTQHCKELEQEYRELNGGKIYDFFSGLEIRGKVYWHHLKNRVGDFYKDKEWLRPVMQEMRDGIFHNYHIDYHQMNIEELLTKQWYLDTLARLKAIDISLYRKELKRIEKAGLDLDITN
uniref:Uncharacterized protein n=1 Tax=viral metagenome TaxID=1070528 RepID=A0A6M3JFY8_9ZZZZ